jgi:transposase
VRTILDHIDALSVLIARVEGEIEGCLRPYDVALHLLQTIPGINATVAAAIIAEIGVDLARFPSAKHLASWAGLCPGNKQSGSRRLNAPTNEGNRWLRGMLGEVVWVITHTKDNYLLAQYQRLVRRRGKYKAVVAVEHTLLVIIYHVLRISCLAPPTALHRFGRRLLRPPGYSPY